jgi:hypothetical protein
MPCLLLADICNRLDSLPAAGAWNGSAKHHFAVGSSALAGLRVAVAVLTTFRAELRFSRLQVSYGPKPFTPKWRDLYKSDGDYKRL